MSLNKTTDQVTIWKQFDQSEYPAYDNYAAFEVSKVADLPKDKKVEATIDSSNLKDWRDTYHDDLQVLSDDGKKAKIKVQRPIWGVPITFMDKYNPSSTVSLHNLGRTFDIIGLDRYTVPKEKLVGGRVAINGKPKYARILIRLDSHLW